MSSWSGRYLYWVQARRALFTRVSWRGARHLRLHGLEDRSPFSNNALPETTEVAVSGASSFAGDNLNVIDSLIPAESCPLLSLRGRAANKIRWISFAEPVLLCFGEINAWNLFSKKKLCKQYSHFDFGDSSFSELQGPAIFL